MAKDVNKCIFIGRLGKDPEIKYDKSGKAMAIFSIACGDDYKDKSGAKVEQTEWINMVAFDKLAEIIGEYVKKGSRIYAEGQYKTRKFTGEDGVERYATSIRLENMQMLDSKPADGQQSQQSQPRTRQEQSPGHRARSAQPPDPDGFGGVDDIPF
jgi:single-strand DNA-binding protein